MASARACWSSRVDQDAEFTSTQGVHRAILISSQDRFPRGKRFQKHNSKPFSCRRHGEQIADAIIIRKLLGRNAAGKQNRIRNLLFLRHSFEPLFVVPASDDQILRPGNLGSNRGQRANYTVVSLVAFRGRKPPDRENDRIVGRQPEPAEQMFRFGANAESRQIQRVVKHAHLLDWNRIGAHHPIAGILADRQEDGSRSRPLLAGWPAQCARIRSRAAKPSKGSWSSVGRRPRREKNSGGS